jgi:nitrous oxide reductase accessory protein NosL
MAQIVFNDQTASTFDSPVDMFRFLNNMIVFDKQHKLADVGAIWVADYGTKAWVDARKAFYVIGSKALGPMNDPNLPPSPPAKPPTPTSRPRAASCCSSAR